MAQVMKEAETFAKRRSSLQAEIAGLAKVLAFFGGGRQLSECANSRKLGPLGFYSTIKYMEGFTLRQQKL